jgi:sugar phosphate isomerase/epimerase
METRLPTKAPDSIDDAVEAGYGGLELGVDGPDPGDDPLWTPESRTRIRRRARERGVEIPSICLGFLNRGGLTSDAPDVRADARAVILRAIDAAAAVGADDILVPFFGDGEIETETHENRVVEGISAVADAAAAADVTLALENTLSAAENLDLLERIDSPAVAHYYDVGNATALGYDPTAEIRDLGDHIAAVHYKDRDETGSYMIGEGGVDFDACTEALQGIGYDGWVVLETASPGEQLGDATENGERAREFVSG